MTASEPELKDEPTLRHSDRSKSEAALEAAEARNSFSLRLASFLVALATITVGVFLGTADSELEEKITALISVPALILVVFYLGYLIGVQRELRLRRNSLESQTASAPIPEPSDSGSEIVVS